MRQRILSMVTAFCLITGTAAGETILLPSGLDAVDEYAFANDTAISRVVLPEGMTAIRSGAFADCTGMREIVIPASVTTLAEDAFDGCPSPMLISTEAGSEAMRYAIAHGRDYRADTVCRALVIGQSEYDSVVDLPGSANDAFIMKKLLSLYGYSVTVRQSLTADEIRTAISNVFGGAQPQDISLVYYSGHGMFTQDEENLGALCGRDGSLVTGQLLRSWLDAIPGRKVIIIDSCYSGSLIGRSVGSVDKLAQDLLAPFTRVARSGELAAEGYYVITAARSTQESYETQMSNGQPAGIFTYSLAKTCGYRFDTDSYCECTADTDGDGAVSLQEAYQSARVAASGMYAGQTAQVYPRSCAWFGILRKPQSFKGCVFEKQHESTWK